MARHSASLAVIVHVQIQLSWVGVQDGEDNLEREVNEITNEGHTDKQSLTEAESDSDSVLSTLSTDTEDMEFDT